LQHLYPVAQPKCTVNVEFVAPPPPSPSGPMTGTLQYGFTYGSNPILNGNVVVTLKGTVK
jgi:hypothetical protein